MSNNIDRLGNVLASRMKKTTKASTQVVAELGYIDSSMALTTDGLQDQIPQGEYMIDKSLTLSSGDRVLVIWCGMEPIVVAAVEDS